VEENSSVTKMSMSKSCVNRGLNCVLQLFVITNMQTMFMPSETTSVFRILMSSNNQQTNCLVIFCSTHIATKHEICSVWLVLLIYGPYTVLIT